MLCRMPPYQPHDRDADPWFSSPWRSDRISNGSGACSSRFRSVQLGSYRRPRSTKRRRRAMRLYFVVPMSIAKTRNPQRAAMSEIREVNEACSRFFGPEVTVGQRASQILCDSLHVSTLFGAAVSVKSDFDVFANILANSPACADILMRRGLRAAATYIATADVELQRLTALLCLQLRSPLNGSFPPNGFFSDARGFDQFRRTRTSSWLPVRIGPLHWVRRGRPIWPLPQCDCGSTSAADWSRGRRSYIARGRCDSCHD